MPLLIIIIVAVLAVIMAYFLIGSGGKKNTATTYNKWGFDKNGKDSCSRTRAYYINSYKKLSKRCLNLKQLHDQRAYDDVASAARGIAERAMRECIEHWGYATGDFFRMIDTAQKLRLLDQDTIGKLHQIRRLGNDALHGNAEITQPQAYFCYKASQEIIDKIFSRIISVQW